MKKIPTLFKRVYNSDGRTMLTEEVNEGLEWVLQGIGLATVKWDGTPVLFKSNQWYKRFDYKAGRKLPEDAVPCQEAADPITGHFPHWVPILWSDPSNKYICAAINNYVRYGSAQIAEGTYEAIGQGINGNPYDLTLNTLKYHGDRIVTAFPRDFQRMGAWLRDHLIEGIVFWADGEPKCKIKRSDFGYAWPLNRPARGCKQ